MEISNVVFLVLCFHLAAYVNAERDGSPAASCVIELECAECIPDNMPLVVSHRAAEGVIRAANGDSLLLTCGAGKFLTYPLLDTLTAECAAGRYRVARDGALRHLLELGCQENIFEDALHHVEQCPPPLQGRSYQASSSGHMATLCYDEDRALAIRARASNAPRNVLPMTPHSHRTAPLTLIGNFNHMFDAKTRHDAEQLYSDDIRMNRRLHELLRFHHYSYADQTLSSAKLLSPHYFEDQNMRVTDFVSNRVAVWKSVASGNLRHLHEDVAQLMRASKPHTRVDVYAGTHGVASLRTGTGARTELYLKGERRFPVPKYLWTVVYAPERRQGTAIVLLNDPFVAVSEIRDAVFCESACSQLTYATQLRRNRNYECPLYGLIFCCDLHSFTAVVQEMPLALVNVTAGPNGLLTDLLPPHN